MMDQIKRCTCGSDEGELHDEWCAFQPPNLEEALELLSAVTQSDGKVSDLLFNQIQAALKKWGEV